MQQWVLCSSSSQMQSLRASLCSSAPDAVSLLFWAACLHFSCWNELKNLSLSPLSGIKSIGITNQQGNTCPFQVYSEDLSSVGAILLSIQLSFIWGVQFFTCSGRAQGPDATSHCIFLSINLPLRVILVYYDSCATSSLLISRLPAVFSPVFILLGNAVFDQTNFSWEASSFSDPLFFFVLLLACFLLYKRSDGLEKTKYPPTHTHRQRKVSFLCFILFSVFWIKVFLKKRTAQILSELEAVEEKPNISTKKRIHFLANINLSSDEFSWNPWYQE